MAEHGREAARTPGSAARALLATARMLAVIGGLLSCAMAAIVTVSVIGRYLFNRPISGDYDIVGILCGCAIFAFLPYCQLQRGNVLADFFTARAPARVKAYLDAAGALIYLATAVLLTWRLYYGALEMRQSAEVIAAFDFYRWWTIPFDLLCMVVLILAIAYTLAQDLAAARTGAAPAGPAAEAGRHE
jgi:TRAP-type C4-dicarboxylate transport system permease small subunit